MIIQILSYLYFGYFFASSAFLVCVVATACLFTMAFDPNRRLAHFVASCWGHHYIRMNPLWDVKFEGVEGIDPKKPAVIVANHQSYWDIMLLYGIFKPFKWVSKESIYRVPFIGWNMMLNQYVMIARGDLKSIKEMMADCRKWLNQGTSIMIFPEGTRSPDGEIKDFRDGPFKLATDCKVPVIPIVVNGTHDLLPKDSLTVNFCGPLRVKVLPPVHPEDFETVRKMREHVRDMMISTLAEMRGKSIEAEDKSKTNAATLTAVE